METRTYTTMEKLVKICEKVCVGSIVSMFAFVWFGGPAGESIGAFFLVVAVVTGVISYKLDETKWRFTRDAIIGRKKSKLDAEIKRVKETYNVKRDQLSTNHARKQMSGLVSLIRDEIRRNKKYISPVILKQINDKIYELIKAVEVEKCIELYEILKKHDEYLNEELRKYLG